MTCTFIVTDIETDGPYPGVHSMLSLASVACNARDSIVDDFEVNLEPLAGMTEHPEVMDWWRTQPEA